MIGVPVHIERVKGWGACGKQARFSTTEPKEVSCLLCRKTYTFRIARDKAMNRRPINK